MHNPLIVVVAAAALVAVLAPGGTRIGQQRRADQPFLTSELIFPLEHWHNHASMVVELSDRSLLVCWFHGSGERTADDVVIRGARMRPGASRWSEPFLMADTAAYPDTNPTMFIDPKKRLWLLWPTILANEWHTALMKYKIASDYLRDGSPRWEVSEVLHVTPGDEFAKTAIPDIDRLVAERPKTEQTLAYAERLKKDAADKLARRLGWMTRAHPTILDGTRLIVPLYSDGFSFSLMAITDDWGATWRKRSDVVGCVIMYRSILWY
jgi:hypothetical protein